MAEHISQILRKKLDSSLMNRGLLCILLSPILILISFVWALVAYLRRSKGYVKFNVLGEVPSNLSVICVGNILVGGTGKTPIVRAIASRHLQNGECIAIASRGISSDSVIIDSLLYTREDLAKLSDENREHFELLKLNFPNHQFFIYQNKNRFESLRVFLNKIKIINPKQAFFILDDGLQYFKCPRHINICICDQKVDGIAPFYSLPFGPYREGFGRKSIERVLKNFDICLWPQFLLNQENTLNNKSFSFFHRNNQKIFYHIKFVKCLTFDDQFQFDHLNAENLCHLNVDESIIVSGIAHPERMTANLVKINSKFLNCEKVYLADHGQLNDNTLEKILTKKILILTLKDFFRFCNHQKFSKIQETLTIYGCYPEYESLSLNV